MAAWIAACAAATARSAAPSASSSVSSSGASAAMASSDAVTARSFSCNANNVSSSRCTSPPRSNFVTRIPFAELIEHASLLRDQRRLALGALEGELIIEPLELALESPGFHPIDGHLVHLVRIASAQPLGLEMLVGAGRRVVQRQHSVVGDALEYGAIGRELEFLGIDGFGDPRAPRFALKKEEQESLLGVGRQNGGRGWRTVEDGGGGPNDLPFQHVLPHSRRFRRPRDVQLPRDRILRGTDRRQESVEGAAPARKRAEESFPLEDLDLPLEDVHGVLEERFQPGGPMPLDERVGVFPNRKGGHADP